MKWIWICLLMIARSFEDGDPGRQLPDEAQIAGGVLGEQRTRGALFAGHLHGFGVALGRHHEQRPEPGRDEEPARQRDAEREPADHRPHQEPGRDDGEVDDQDVLEADAVGQLHGDVRREQGRDGR